MTGEFGAGQVSSRRDGMAVHADKSADLPICTRLPTEDLMRSRHISPRYGKVETRFVSLRTLDGRAERHHTRIEHRLDEIRIDPLVRQTCAN